MQTETDRDEEIKLWTAKRRGDLHIVEAVQRDGLTIAEIEQRQDRLFLSIEKWLSRTSILVANPPND